MEREIFINTIYVKLSKERCSLIEDLSGLKDEGILLRGKQLDKDYEQFIKFVYDPEEISGNNQLYNPITNILTCIQDDCLSFINVYSQNLENIKCKQVSDKSALIDATIKIIVKVYKFFKWYHQIFIDISFLLGDVFFSTTYPYFRVYPHMLYNLHKKWVKSTIELRSPRDQNNTRKSQLTPTLIDISTNEPYDDHNLPSTPRKHLFRTKSDAKIPHLNFHRSYQENLPKSAGREINQPKETHSAKDFTTHTTSRHLNSPRKQNHISPRDLFNFLFKR